MAFKRSAVRSRLSPPKKIRYTSVYLIFFVSILRVKPGIATQCAGQITRIFKRAYARSGIAARPPVSGAENARFHGAP